MVMLGASCRLVTSRINLDWTLERRNALDICVVRMIIILCFNIILCAMKLVGVAIVPNYQYLGNVSYNPRSVLLVVSFATLHPLVYKLVVAKYIVLFKNFQIFQELQSIWAPIHIQLQKGCVENPSRR
jgi:hypothetical protein